MVDTARGPLDFFHSHHYLEINARRLEHLASLGIPVQDKSVLEVGAGIGDLSGYFTNRGCDVLITEARRENIQHIRRRHRQQTVQMLDMDVPAGLGKRQFDITFSYGLLYHLNDPLAALDFWSEKTRDFLLLETCVSFGDELAMNKVDEPAADPTQAVSGAGCRPTRPWLFQELKARFQHVYVTRTQPWHSQFPLDWTDAAAHGAGFQRSVFVASRSAIANPNLSEELLMQQTRHT